MLGFLRNLFGGRRQGPAAAPSGPNRQQIRARYDAATTTRENLPLWPMVDYLSAKAANSFNVRRELKIRSRYEAANNSYYRGITDTLANDLVGPGPHPHLLTDSPAKTRQVLGAWKDWARAVALGDKLRLMAKAKIVDGEGFGLLTTNPLVPGPIQLDLAVVESDQCTTPDPGFIDYYWVDGVVLNKNGDPTEYHFLRHHPGDLFIPQLNPLVYDRWKPRHVCHWFRPDRPGQVRGIPEITPALELFAQLRRYTKAVLAAAESAADMAILLKTVAAAGTDDEPANGEPWDHVPLERGTMTVLPEGYDASQMKAEQPVTTYDTFVRTILREIARCLSIPLNIALGDSSDLNYSSGRLDHLGYHRGQRVDRSRCEHNAMDKVWREWYAEARLIRGLLPPGLPPDLLPSRWYWHGSESIDPVKDATANGLELDRHTRTLQAIYAERGEDWEAGIAQRGLELAALKKAGLIEPPPAAPPGKTPPKGGPVGRKAAKAAAADLNINVRLPRPGRSQPAAARPKDHPIRAFDPDQPRDDDGRFAGGDEHEQRHERETSELEHKQAGEKEALETRHAGEQDAQSAGHDKERAALSDRHDSEGADDARREADEKALAGRHDEESAQLDQAHEKEAAALDQAHDKEAAQLEGRHEKESAAHEKLAGKHEDQSTALEGKHEDQTDKLAAKQEKENERAQDVLDRATSKAQDLRDGQDEKRGEQREREDDRVTEGRDRDDSATDATRAAADQAIADRRDTEDAKLTDAQRADPDDPERTETDWRRAQEDEDLQNARDAADEVRDAAREKEDQERQERRDAEDAETEKQRQAEDDARQQQFDKEEAERFDRHGREERELEERQAAETKALAEKHQGEYRGLEDKLTGKTTASTALDLLGTGAGTAREDLDPEVLSLIADIVGGLFGDDQAAELLAYSPDQPRDERGRFSSEGSAGRMTEAREKIKDAKANPTPAKAKDLAKHLSTLTVKQLRELKAEHGLKGSPKNKTELVKKLAEHLRSAPAKPPDKPPDKPVIDPAKPIQDRLAAYVDGDRKVETIAKAGAALDAKIEDWRAASAASRAAMSTWSTKRPGTPASKAAEKEYQAKAKAETKAQAAVDAHRQALHDAADNATRAKNPVSVTCPDTLPDRYTDDNKNKGLDYVGKIVESEPRTTPIPVNFSQTGPRDRANYQLYGSRNGMIELPDAAAAHTAVHELGHHLEYQVPGAQHAANEFRDYRIGNEAPTNLSQKFSNTTYDAGEEGYKDQFDKAFGNGSSAYYVGKKYSDKATEIISMGLQKLYDSPGDFAQKDPEYCKFILGILDGSLRSHK